MKKTIRFQKSGPVIALAGNPNTGKSTLFNYLTGLKQHTGNWPGKTVKKSEGKFIFEGTTYTIIDLPGTYSLLANSVEEEIARDFLCFGNPDATIIVTDATCLERNLNLVLQILEITSKAVVCVNLIDEAKRKNIVVDVDALSRELGVPAIATCARTGEGITQLLKTVQKIVNGKIITTPVQITYDQEIENYISKFKPQLQKQLKGKLNPRWVALRFLEGNQKIINSINDYLGTDIHLPDIGEVS